MSRPRPLGLKQREILGMLACGWRTSADLARAAVRAGHEWDHREIIALASLVMRGLIFVDYRSGGDPLYRARTTRETAELLFLAGRPLGELASDLGCTMAEVEQMVRDAEEGGR